MDTMTRGAQAFLEENIDLIDKNDWREFMTRVKLDFTLNRYDIRDIRKGLDACDIDPIQYIDFIPAEWFSGETSLSVVTIPNNIKEIGNSAFRACPNLTEVNFPDYLVNISYYAFMDCISLQKVDLSKYPMSQVGSALFKGCLNLQEVKLPKVMEHIGTCTFQGCTMLNNIVLPKSLKVIDKEVFEGCVSLSNISFEGTKEDWIKIRRYDRCFVGIPAKTIMCSDGITKLRPTAGHWQG